MSVSTSIQEIGAKADKVKLAQGVALLVVAVLVAVGVTSLAAPLWVWQVVVRTVANGQSGDIAISNEAALEAMTSHRDLAVFISTVLAVSYPAYHALWRILESIGCEYNAKVFNKKVSKRIAAVDACTLISTLLMGFGFKMMVEVLATNNESGSRTLAALLVLGALVTVPACAVVCLVKWFVSRGPAREWGHGLIVELVRLSDTLLSRASSNLVLMFVAELFACALSMVFLAACFVIALVVLALGMTAIALVLTIGAFIIGIPLFAASSDK